MARTKPNRRTEGLPTDPNAYKKELIKKAKDFYLNRKGGKEYFDSLNKEQKISAGNILQFRDDNFDALGFTKDGLGESSPLYGKRFDDNQFVEMFDQTKNFIGPGLREGATPENHLFRPEKEPALRYFLEGKMGKLYRPDDSRIFDYLGLPRGAKTQHDQYDDEGRMKMREGGRADMSNDKITQILKQMHDMEDEPVKMQSGGTVYTPEQYATSYVDYFSPFSIQVDVPDPGDDTGDDDRDVNINIQEPVTGGDDAPNIFAGTNITNPGQPTFSYSKINASDHISQYEKTEKQFKDLSDRAFDSGKGFSAYMEQQLGKRSGVAVTGVAGLAMGMPGLGAIGAAAGSLNRKQHYETAKQIKATGGGDIFEVNGQTLSRKPGSGIINGTLGNMTQEQAQRFAAIKNDFIPGTMRDVAVGPDADRFETVGKSSMVTDPNGTFAMDPYGNIHDAGGIQGGRASQAEKAREALFEKTMLENGQGAKLAELKRTGGFSRAAQQFKQTYNTTMNADRPFIGTVAGMSDSAYADLLAKGNKTAANIIRDTYGVTGTTTTFVQTPLPSTESDAKDPSFPSGDDSDRDDGRPTFRDSEGRRESVTITAENVSRHKEFENQYDEDDFIDESGRFTEGFGKDDSDSGDKDDKSCVIATHGLSTGGFTPMEKAKAELWCQKTYHGKWYGEAFRRGYRAAGQRAIDSGNAEKYYQEFKDFVAYGRGVKRGWRLGFNYYLRTLSFFLSGLFISE